MTSSLFPKGIYVCGLGVKEVAQVTLEANTLLQNMGCVIHMSPGESVDNYLANLGVRIPYNLHSWYADGKDRSSVYERIARFVLEQYGTIDRVCYLAPGNPIFLNRIVLNLISKCEYKDIPLHILSGVSSIDTILTDLKLPSGDIGIQCYEATMFCLKRPKIDTSVPLFLFQPGNLNSKLVQMLTPPTRDQIKPLARYLIELYSPETRWILTGSAGTLGQPPVVIWNYLSSLLEFSRLLTLGTLVIPGNWWPSWIDAVPSRSA